MENKDFKDFKLPVPVWDEEREVLEYVYNMDVSIDGDHEVLQIDNSLTNALGNVASAGFYYSFTSGYFQLPTLDDEVKEHKIVVGHTHAHLFDEVVESLYNFPESFSISEDEEQFYSKQELEYLKKVKKYLLFIGLKDITLEEFENRSTSRYLNVDKKEYLGLVTSKYDDTELDRILNGDLRTKVFVTDYIDIYENKDEYEDKVLVMDSNYDVKVCLKFYKYEVKTYGEVKDFYTNAELNDDDKVVVEYFDIVERF